MNTALIMGVLAYQVVCSFSLRATNCLSIKEACISESDSCRSGWDLLTNVCRITDGSCRIIGSKECNMTIAYLLDQFPAWSRCLCTEKDYCRAPQLLAPDCPTHSDGQTSNSPPIWTENEPDTISASMSPESQNCFFILHACRESLHCWSVYEKVRDSCSSEDQCGTLASRSSCLLLWGELKSTPLANCTCPVGERKCLKVRALLQNNPCIRMARQAPPPYLPQPDARHRNHLRGGAVGMVELKKDSKEDWQRSSLLEHAHDTVSSCLSTMTACIYDEVCNARLVPLVQACSAGQCQPGACGRATRRFYHGLPRGVAEMLVFCECNTADRDCLRVRADLQSGTCAGRPDQAPTCLEVYDRCMVDPLCRQRYRTFQARCLGEGEETLCHTRAPNDCLCPLDPDLIPGGDAQCRRAFVGTMGTVLQQPCTCDGLQTAHLHKCKRLHEVLHNRSVFNSHLNKGASPHHTTQGNETGLRVQWFSDQLFFALVCVLVIVIILMVVIMLLRTLGMCRKAERDKFRPPPVRKNCPVFY
ncbi:hypothetical protein AAFF_G00254620 [Aldrovandia affinis]|uniref:GDNF/GAS1 domain-containing protein n=1 Tax=Aldrovandia affinis TaxID=143900 RepID=A0AAD7RCT1_9TELE|nr:hypothetical protein AAFF_G00254620 [Aldrovandia affinis]